MREIDEFYFKFPIYISIYYARKQIVNFMDELEKTPQITNNFKTTYHGQIKKKRLYR